MPLSTAQSLALSLARTLMAIVLVIRTDDGFAVLTCDEFDGDPLFVVREYDPFG